MPRAPCTAATTEAQNESLAELRREVKWAIYEGAGDDRTIYHRVSCKPITLTAEDDMELLSDVFSQGETFLHYWEEGHYGCSRCGNKVFSSEDKWKGYVSTLCGERGMDTKGKEECTCINQNTSCKHIMQQYYNIVFLSFYCHQLTLTTPLSVPNYNSESDSDYELHSSSISSLSSPLL